MEILNCIPISRGMALLKFGSFLMKTILTDSAGRDLVVINAKYKSNNSMCFNTYSKVYTSCVCPVSNYCAEV